MNDVIVSIYNGNLCFGERIIENDCDYIFAKSTAEKAHEAFEKKLCSAMRVEFDEYLSKEAAVNGFYSEQAFSDGFKLGAKLMLEIFSPVNRLQSE